MTVRETSPEVRLSQVPANPDLVVALGLVRLSRDPYRLASAILRALPPWPAALAAARAIVEREDARRAGRRSFCPARELADAADRAMRGTSAADVEFERGGK